jgi:acetoin utilization protein AcuB
MPPQEPAIQMYMSMAMNSIQAGELLEKAMVLMEKQKIRHLPVMMKDKVIGMLSDRDIKLAGSILGEDANKLPVIDVCNQSPYTVSPETPLRTVATTMADKQYGSAIVLKDGKLVGIFTTTDACRALSDIIRISNS